MHIKKEDPSKVIIVPRPPREMNANLVPLEPENAEAVEAEAVEAEAEEEEVAQEESPVVAGPGFEPMNNQVEGPALGLAGVPKAE